MTFSDRVKNIAHYMRPLAAMMAFGAHGMIAGMILTVAVINYYSKDLPDYQQLAEYNPSVMTRLYAADRELIAEYAKEKRIFVPLAAIPRKVIEAFLSAEDKYYYAHKGVDFYGIARAVRENISNYGSGRSMVGGSTITQQVVKNFLLTNEKSFERKIKEAILAFRLSQTFTKDEILELYLNEIYLGKGAYGVAAAALRYFSKPLNELTTEELALLAALPKAPATLDPDKNPDGALARRNYVIGRMYKDGYLTEAEAKRAEMTPIQLDKRPVGTIARGDFFAEEVRRTLVAQYGVDTLYSGGLTVFTTLDTTLQDHADNALRDALIAYDRRHGYRGPIKRLAGTTNWQEALLDLGDNPPVPLIREQTFAAVLSVEKEKAIIGLPDARRAYVPLSEMKWARKSLTRNRIGPRITQARDVVRVGDVVMVAPMASLEGAYHLQQVPKISGAMVVMDPRHGEVLAMSGGYSYDKSEFNRATQALRQPGSAFKPFAYLAALENGFTPTTLIMDAPIEIPQGPGKPMWRPQNYGGDYLGATTIRMGLEKSRNTMTVRLAQMVGLGRIIRVAKRFGVYDDAPKNFSMVLGAQETTLLKLVNGYAMLANGGKKVSPTMIERIDDRHGSIFYRADNRECKGCTVNTRRPMANATPPLIEDTREQVADTRIVYQVTSMLEGVVQRGTATKAKVVGHTLAGKTGTTNDSRDAWFVGYSPELVVGVYIGFDQPQSLGDKETGGRVALPGFVDFMKMALKEKPKREFIPPQGINIVSVDRRTGYPVYEGMSYEGQTIIKEAMLSSGHIFKPSLPAGEVDDEPPVQVATPSATDEWRDTYEYEQESWGEGWQQVPQQQWGRTVPAQQPSYGYQQQQPATQPQNRFTQNPYQLRRRDVRRRSSGRGAASSGTGGLY